MTSRQQRCGPLIAAATLTILTAVSALLYGTQSEPTKRLLLRVVVRSFIPGEQPRNPGYVRSIPGPPPLLVIPSPQSGCFATDGRSFSTLLDAPSRVTTEFVLAIDGSSVKLATAGNRQMFRVEPLRNVDCTTGVDMRPPQTPAADPMTIDTLAFYEGVAQIVFSASVRNPFALEPVPGRIREDAALRYGGNLIYDTRAGTVNLKGFVSIYPAFEAFAEDELGTYRLFQASPEAGTTAWGLYDPQRAITTRPVEVTISLR